jgi:periplasmic protein CpxP/Spy
VVTTLVRRSRSTLARAALALVLLAGVAPAQLPGGPPAAPQAPAESLAPPRRAAMEQQLRRALWTATKRRVGLTEPQMTRLGDVTRALEPRRAALLQRERVARRALRAEMTAAQPNETRVGELLEEMQRVQRARLELVEGEQRQLAAFMTPVQRARYFALQEQFRRRLEEMRRGDAALPAARRRARVGAPLQ